MHMDVDRRWLCARFVQDGQADMAHAAHLAAGSMADVPQATA